MNAEEDYGFDVYGYLHLSQVLTPAEIEACTEAVAAAGQNGKVDSRSATLVALSKHPVLTSYLESLCGAGFVLDKPPALVPDGPSAAADVPLAAGPVNDHRRLRYTHKADTRLSRGVRLFLALAPTPESGGIVMVPCSHTRTAEPPAAFLSGDDDMGMAEELELKAGDVVLCSANTLFGVRGRPGQLIQMEVINSATTPAGGFAEAEAPEWTKELTPEQQAVVGSRTTGRGATVISDGERAWVASVEEQPASVAFNLDEHSQPDPAELWFWDVRGYLVMRGVMDEEWLAAANRAVDAAMEMQDSLPAGHPTVIEDVPEQALRENDWKWPEDTSPRLYGEINRPRIGGLYELPKPHCDPFRRMIGHPPVVQRLNWLLGYGFKEGGDPMCCAYPKGTTGGSLHGQNSRAHTYYNGRELCDQVNVAWALKDEVPGFGEGSGGFICVPGSHKAHYTIPRPLTTSIDLPQVYKPAMKAGDVLFFGAIAHGTTAWRSDWDRRTTIQFMKSSNVAVRPGRAPGWRWSNDAANPANVKASKG